MDYRYTVEFTPKTVKTIKRKQIDANGNQVMRNGLPAYEDAYVVRGKWRSHDRSWKAYVPDRPKDTPVDEQLAKYLKDKMELVGVGVTVSTDMATLDQLQNAEKFTVTGVIEDWGFAGSVYYRGQKHYSRKFARAVAPTLSGPRMRADSITMRQPNDN